jgi:hypothetical protein
VSGVLHFDVASRRRLSFVATGVILSYAHAGRRGSNLLLWNFALHPDKMVGSIVIDVIAHSIAKVGFFEHAGEVPNDSLQANRGLLAVGGTAGEALFLRSPATGSHSSGSCRRGGCGRHCRVVSGTKRNPVRKPGTSWGCNGEVRSRLVVGGGPALVDHARWCGLVKR